MLSSFGVHVTVEGAECGIDIKPFKVKLASAQNCALGNTTPYEEEFTSSEQTISGDNLIPEDLTDRIIQEILERLEKSS